MNRHKILCLGILLLVLSGCGDGSSSCEGVDTSQAPDSILTGPAGTTYRWGNCTRTYP